MKSLLLSFKVVLFYVLKFIVFIVSFYLSALFFIILFTEEALKEMPNDNLNQEFTLIINKINDLPGRLFDEEERKETDLSRLF